MDILVTGGTGSLGTALVPRLIKDGHDVTVLSRDPHKQNALRSIAPEATFVLGDVCDSVVVGKVVDGMDCVIHAAALKHVDAGEANVAEYVRVNILGSRNVVDACLTWSVPTAILISSDKAVDPVNLYGKTKSVAEDLFVSAGYSAIRYGNVVSSRGSFLNVWEDRASKGQKIVLREPSPTRFFLSIDGACDLVMSSVFLDYMQMHSGVFVPKHLRAFSIEMAASLFFDEDEIERLPLGLGEKQHEVLLSKNEVVTDEFLITNLIEKGHGEFPEKYCSETCEQISLGELALTFSEIVGPVLKERMENR